MVLLLCGGLAHLRNVEVPPVIPRFLFDEWHCFHERFSESYTLPSSGTAISVHSWADTLNQEFLSNQAKYLQAEWILNIKLYPHLTTLLWFCIQPCSWLCKHSQWLISVVFLMQFSNLPLSFSFSHSLHVPMFVCVYSSWSCTFSPVLTAS